MVDVILTALKAALGDDGVLAGADIGERYRCDATGVAACAPLAVLRPRSTETVAQRPSR